ncbi:MAG: hypothetical protein H6662_08370 [Ardenticatenaceae bacterium]|nr:hypothetical protein [Anaerolineales bacterium]MCB8921581.1 hypothetical protein [Ardenticatenaceae bacterium]MCB9003882.1 hypothetical protein [Ardenticatenaceae bacterium]
MDNLAKRARRVAESLLENESLTADLNDTAAQGLLDWGLQMAQRVVDSTTELDDEAAEEVMYPRLKATRRMMRSVNRLVANARYMPPEDSAAMLDGIIEKAAATYGAAFSPPAPEDRAAFVQLLAEMADEPHQLIAYLQHLLEASWQSAPDEEE